MGGQHNCTYTNSKLCPLTVTLDTQIKPSIALWATALQHSLVATFLNSLKIQKQYFKLNPGHTTDFSLYVLPIELGINIFLSLKDWLLSSGFLHRVEKASEQHYHKPSTVI